MAATETKHPHSAAQVILFPARTPDIGGKRVFFLLSVRQVAEVLKHADVQPVPFGPSHVEGIAEWCGRVLPVLSLEQFLGLKMCEGKTPVRPIVVRSVIRNSDGLHELYAICRLAAASQQVKLPLKCEPAAAPGWIVNRSCLSGVYQTQESLLMAPDLDRILTANNGEKGHVPEVDLGKRNTRGH